MEAEADMNRDLDLMFDEAARVDDELGAHAAAVSASTESSAVDAVEKAHHDVMLPQVDALDHMLADMTTYCRHRETQERGRTHDMQAAMTSMRREFERHRATPRTDLAAARTEEERHLREGRAILTGLRDAGTAMRHEAGFYLCQHRNH